MLSVAASSGPQRPGGTFPNSVLSSDGSSEAAILVAVRVRPFSSKELALIAKPSTSQFGLTARNFMNYEEPVQEPVSANGSKAIRKVVHAIDDHVLVFDPPDENVQQRALVGASNKRHKDIRFVFDRVYGEASTQRDVYEGTTRGLLDSVMNGYNATVFAYGATGCGKTYTISGCADDPGVVFLTMQELFDRVALAEDERTVEVALSYLEVYNETIRDLLCESGPLALREDAKQSVTVAGLSEHVPHSVTEVMDLMVRGNANRTMSPTEANAVSSRSHAVLQVHVRQKPRSGGLQTDVTSATLSIIDLAGSERATVALNSNARMREGANINRSLLALANCINALCDQKTKRHIPYRDSKLTRMLKFSLGGNCRTVMITCVSPASTYFEETHNTLKYANRAKNIKTTVNKNTKSTQVHLAQYQGKIKEQSEEIARLQREIALLRSKASSSSAGSSKSSAQAAQAMAELRKQTQAVQVVQDTRNKLATAYAPIGEATWEHASAEGVGAWFDHHADGLRAWREHFETQFQEHQHSDMDVDDDVWATHAKAYRQQVDELLRDLIRERKTISRHAEHSSQLIERHTFTATRAAQVPPSVPLTAEQSYQITQEARLLGLSAERNSLRRRAELADHAAHTLAIQNAALLKLTATCLCDLKRAQHRPETTQPAIERIYMQAIASFSEATGSMRASMNLVQSSGGPSKLSINGLPLIPPSPYVPRLFGDSGAAKSAAAELSADNRQRPVGLRPGAMAAAPGSMRNPNTAAISAAVAGTTRARRAATTAAPVSGATQGLPSMANGAGLLPPLSQQQPPLAATRPMRAVSAAAGRSAAVRFNGSGVAETAALRPRATSRPALSNGGNGATAAAAANGRGALAASRNHPAAGQRAKEDGNAGRPAASGISPAARKLMAANPLPSPTTSNGTASPASSVASWASAETSPHHEPLPPAARPLKGILKSSMARCSNSDSIDDKPGSAQPGPVRLGSVRRKSRQARSQANPTLRITPTKPTVANGSSRELSFKSVAAPNAAAANKKPLWR
ncbi:tubulin-dependent ATPase kip3 [Coemansia thaxteri]|uniref:Kinesin-like protein KIN-8B n=1 Tax=Coemansia thaxteri TaxID=2663907 RepID=A0A9W8BDZ9_9FUNG|nr:tubulin-dependent ATPase kip3 [Coemansia thaxteri]